MAGLHLALRQRGEALVLAVEDQGLAFEDEAAGVHPCALHDAAAGRQIAEKHCQPTVCGVGLFDRANDPGILDVGRGKDLAQRLAGDCHRVEIHDAGLLRYLLQDGGDAARAVHVLDVHIGHGG